METPGKPTPPPVDISRLSPAGRFPFGTEFTSIFDVESMRRIPVALIPGVGGVRFDTKPPREYVIPPGVDFGESATQLSRAKFLTLCENLERQASKASP